MAEYTADQVEETIRHLETRDHPRVGRAINLLTAYAATLRQQAVGVDEATYAAIGRAFREVLADPSMAWRDTGAKGFIDRVCAKTATVSGGQPGDITCGIGVARFQDQFDAGDEE